ncbi:MAG: hypothetical protein QOJ35_3238 [Solirubrobacteraceae bacterium]|jgi:hypothetical protein|nr:hypothetical protein [Solirubrobacteraceae bacterium]
MGQRDLRPKLAPAMCTARHGTAVPRGQDPGAGIPGGRFGRMFPHLPPCEPTDAEIDALVACMRPPHGYVPADNIEQVPAGYTYFGQFVDHDITFDPLSHLQRRNDPHALVNFRTPRFDLDSLYGSGPKDQPFLYDWDCESHPGVKLLVGSNPCDRRKLALVDLPRNAQGRALIGDARNDENLIVAQLHLLLIKFHNKVVERLRTRQSTLGCDELLAEAQRFVRWHYQWLVINDFLKRRVGGPAAARALKHRRFYAASDEPVIPLEFSAAAYRFGHSMVRGDYLPKSDAPQRFPIFRKPGDDRLSFRGFQPLPEALEIQWDLFFPGPKTSEPNRSTRIDPLLVVPLFSLPDGAELARLNLQRGRALGLPSGPDVARAMSIAPLTDAQLGAVSDLPATTVAQLRASLATLPLWVYILTEAYVDSGGTSLGRVGGQIVAEVLIGLLEADPNSYVRRQPNWTPELSDGPDEFDMGDIVRYVQDPTRL